MSLPSNTLGLLIICLDVTFLFLGAVALGIRLKSRSLLKQQVRLNDYLALLAWPLAAGHVCTVVIAVVHGVGQHVHEVSVPDIITILKCHLIAQMTLSATNTAIKVSILCFYLTLFHPNRAFRLATFIMIGLALCYSLGVLLAIFLSCRPVSRIWDLIHDGKCDRSLVRSIVAIGLVNVLIDLGIILLPLPIVWNLQIARSRKVALTFVFSVGLVISAITVTRVAISTKLLADDIIYHLAKLALVTDPEPLLGIIVACAPLFRPTFEAMLAYKRRAFPKRPSSDFVRLTSQTTREAQLRSFDDAYHLDDMEGGRNKTSVTSYKRPPGLCHQDTGASSNDPGTQQPAITVERGWEVRTTSSC